MKEEQYEQIKAQVLEEQKAERREREKERQRINKEAYAMFDETEREYLPKFIVKMSSKYGHYDCVGQCKSRIYEAKVSALAIIGERNFKTAYLNGKSEEANQALRQLLDELLAQ